MLQLLPGVQRSGLSFENVPALVVGGAPCGSLSPVWISEIKVSFSGKKTGLCLASRAVTCGLSSPLFAAVLHQALCFSQCLLVGCAGWQFSS